MPKLSKRLLKADLRRKPMAKTTKSGGTHVFPSNLGWMALTWSDERLTRFTFGHPSAAAAIASLESDDEWQTSDASALPGWVASLVNRLQSNTNLNQ